MLNGDVPNWVNWLTAMITITGALIAVISAFTDWGKIRIGISVIAVGIGVFAVANVAAVILDPDDPVVDACDDEPQDDAVDVMVVWERPEDDDPDQVDELNAFCNVAAEYPHAPIDVQSVGPNIGAALTESITSGDPPDVAIVPQPSVVRRLGLDGHLVPLNDLDAIDHAPDEAEGIPVRWTDLVSTGTGGEDAVWGAVVKGANKSIFWYQTDELGVEEPAIREGWEWDLFADWVAQQANPDGADQPADTARSVPPAPLALAADQAAPWPLTDWFENQLALSAPELYGRLAEGQTVSWDRGTDDHHALSSALTDMANLWGQYGVFPRGDAAPTSTTQSELDNRLRDDDAAAVFHPSFLAGSVNEMHLDDDVRAFRFPGLRSRGRVVVGGDIAVVPEDGDHDAGSRFVDWLTSSDSAMQKWSDEDPGYLVPNWDSPHAVEEPDGGQDDLRQRLTNQLLTYGMPDGGEDLYFDLSDDQFANLAEDDPRATWWVFLAFFEEVSTGGDRAEAVQQVIECLQFEYTGDGEACAWAQEP